MNNRILLAFCNVNIKDIFYSSPWLWIYSPYQTVFTRSHPGNSGVRRNYWSSQSKTLDVKSEWMLSPFQSWKDGPSLCSSPVGLPGGTCLCCWELLPGTPIHSCAQALTADLTVSKGLLGKCGGDVSGFPWAWQTDFPFGDWAVFPMPLCPIKSLYPSTPSPY